MISKPQLTETAPASPTAPPDLPGTGPRRIADPLATNAVVLGYGTLALTVVGRDRCGLLHAVARRVCAADPELNIDRAQAVVLEDVAFVNLLLRPRTAEVWSPAKHAAVCERLRALAGEVCEGTQGPVVRRTKLTVVALDRPGLLCDISGLLAARRVNVRGLDGEVRLEHTGGSAAGVPMCRLTLQLDLPADPEAEPGALTAQLTGLGAKVRSSSI
jgi:predicted amino acid-binding ACT domain protein